MNRVVEEVQFWGVHALHWSLIWFGLFDVNDGVQNVLVFYTWVFMVMSFFLLLDSAIERAASKPGTRSAIKVSLSTMRFLVQAFGLAYLGMFTTASAALVTVVVIGVYRNEVKERREMQEKAPA